MLKHLLTAAVVGLIVVAAGVTILLTANLYPSKTVRYIVVNEGRTDWYSTGPILAQAGDMLEISVDSVGGSAKLRVDTQTGGNVFPEIQNTHLQYEVFTPSDDTYLVIIWTKAWPWPSNYVSLQGSVNQKRTVFELYPMGYEGIGVALAGVFVVGSGFMFYVHDKKLKEEERKLRVCPSCSRKVAIDKPICQFCGFDITRFAQCKYCHAFFDRSLQKCPSCGAKQS